MATTMIEARGLARTYRARDREIEAVRGLDLDVAAGEVVGFLGPNGAGKSTAVRMLTTLLAPTAGSATVAGADLRRDPAGVRRRVGCVPQGGTTDPGVPAGEELALQAALHRVPDAAARIADVAGRLGVADLLDRPCGALSGGQRRRLDLAIGLVHRPPLLFLDEPTTGLDPAARAAVRDHVRGLRDRDGVTVFLTTHYLEEADALCDRVLILDAGRIVAEGSPAALKRRVRGDVVEVAVAAGGAQRARAALAAHPAVTEAVLTNTGVTNTGAAGDRLRLTVRDGERALPGLVRALDDALGDAPGGGGLVSLTLARPTLDDVFRAVTGRALHTA
ncbi:ABC transporter ATP-binding protein [Actinomadura atramentaria]|uniref:ABC transporter ATP-binding protein n=1 Tax=Actinomadura atramentaria TaxID=1990 RepID=UPI00037C9D21|nr:ATP-binding cassette domain-containing protein [Actinomadura atramentaria]